MYCIRLFALITAATALIASGDITVGAQEDAQRWSRGTGSARHAAPAATWLNTTTWVGAEYTPALASNSLWWAEYDRYAGSIDRELAAARERLGFTALRVFLHYSVYKVDGGVTLIEAMHRFLDAAAAHNLRVGFVLFDDCFNKTASVEYCIPTKGVHNSCWQASPSVEDRTEAAMPRLRKYVTNIVGSFRHDRRILWWEVYNEPNISSAFSLQLRDVAYRDAKSQLMRVGESAASSALSVPPVLACWSDNNDTDLVDLHACESYQPAPTIVPFQYA